jgi:hypothetical protein
MASFTIRVELHDATWQNYINLAADLAKQGVTDVITADDGTTYKMSPAEYNYDGAASIDDVLNAVGAAAARTGKKHAVFVTQSTQRKWRGLQAVQQRRAG